MAEAFEFSDLVHTKWQYITCWWWHKHAMQLPLKFILCSLRFFVRDPNTFSVKNILENPGLLLNIDSDRFHGIWSNVFFLSVFVRVVHMALTSHQQYVVSSNPTIYSALTSDNRSN